MPKIKEYRLKYSVKCDILASALDLTLTGFYLKEKKNHFTIEEYRKMYEIFKGIDDSITCEDFFLS